MFAIARIRLAFGWLLALTSVWLTLVGARVSWAQSEPSPPPAFQPGAMTSRFLDGPMKGAEEIIFAERVSMNDHWYVNFGYYSNEPNKPGYGEGGRLLKLNLRTNALTVLLDDPKGGVRDPQVHYDGKKILFSYRKGGTEVFHLCEINADGTGFRQLTDGADDDIEPTYLPDGDIIFSSARCRRFVNCWYSRVTTLYRCDGEGKNIRMLSSNNDHDNTPWVLPDGRILYMRWEYVDRSQVHYHHLWAMNPDGTGQMTYFGNEFGNTVMLDAKPIPGTKKVVVSYSPGHGRPEHIGPVVVVDPTLGPDIQKSAVQIGKWQNFRDPWAFTEGCFMAAEYKTIVVMDGKGDTEVVYKVPEALKHLECHEPRPLCAREREPVIPPRVDLAKKTAQLVLEDVYAGRSMEGVQRGDIKKLLVLQQVPKPVNFSGGMEPLTIGGSFTLAEILGTVPVEPDGSAFVELPALRSLFFVALDQNDMAVKRMQSFVILQPGETTSCVGCHEQRNMSPHFKPDLAAIKKAPQQIEKIAGAPDVIDFPRDVQPILDRRCVECHNPDRFEGRLDLCGDHTPGYTVSYEMITQRHLVADGRNQPKGNRAPRTIGSSASRIISASLGGHYDVKATPEELQMLRLWVETGATYPGTYASLGCGMVGVNYPMKEMVERCGGCHGKEMSEPDYKGMETVFSGRRVYRPQGLCNLARPEKSEVLRAALSREAGGLQLCKEAVFTSTDDPLYKQMLEAIRKGGAALDAMKRFDMPGFRPNEHYIREMRRFGILPADLKPSDPIDVYSVDRAYWHSFDYQPQAAPAAESAAAAGGL